MDTTADALADAVEQLQITDGVDEAPADGADMREAQAAGNALDAAQHAAARRLQQLSLASQLQQTLHISESPPQQRFERLATL